MDIDSCRDRANLRLQRHRKSSNMCHAPWAISVSPRVQTEANKLYDRFCLKCANFENVKDIPVCARDHRPGIAWEHSEQRNPM